MPIPIPERDDIVTPPPSVFISKWILEPVPHLFKGDLDLYIDWKENLSKRIEVDSRAISLVGSAAAGRSLSVKKYPLEFRDTSDVDVAVISQRYFDIAWNHLRNLGPTRHRLPVDAQRSLDEHRERLIYWGTIATDKIIQILPFGSVWVTAATQMGKVRPTESRTINYRLYRDFESLRAYQIQSIRKLQEALLKQ